MSAVSDFDVAMAMIEHGGGFVEALGRAFLKADEINRGRIKMAFCEYWEEYQELVAMIRARANASAR